MADVEERALGWEDELENVSGFPLLPEGDYPFIIEKFDRTRTGSEGKYPNNNMATVYFRVSDNNNTTVTIKENFILNVKFMWKLTQLFRSVGLMKEDDKTIKPDWAKLPGLTGRCHVVQVPGVKNPSQMFNNIGELYPAGEKNFTAGKF